MLTAERDAQRLRVLVAEHRDLVATRLRAQLEGLGHQVVGLARDGREAVEAAHRLRPNLVLMETQLPRLDGVDAARAIVSERPVPVVLLTDYAGAALVRRAREAGVLACVTPADQRRLRSAIDVAVERFGEFQILRREGSDPREALETLRLVDHAKKVLLVRMKLSETEAFRAIVEQGRRTHRSLRATAWTIIDADQLLSRLDLGRSLQLIFQAVRRDLRSRSSDRRSVVAREPERRHPVASVPGRNGIRGAKA